MLKACLNTKNMLDKFFLEEYVKRSGIPNNPRRILTEYLQSEILRILYASLFGQYFTFMGGTALRFVYKIERFSEDLDFERIKENPEYQKLSNFLKKELENLGFVVDITLKETENIFITTVKFSEVMKQMGISDLSDQRLKIKFEIDPRPLKSIRYDSKTVSAYGRTFNIISNDLETIFAQKVLAILFRPYQKGRDFYDLVWFLNQRNLEPNYDIFKEKNIPVRNRKELIDLLSAKIAETDLAQAAKDVEPFLFYPEHAQWIMKLPEYLKEFEDK